MADKLQKVIEWCFFLLFFAVPLVFYPQTSELFEFNKITLTYLFAIIIFFAWGLKSIISKKFTFTTTTLFLPLVIFLASQVLSTIFSIDRHTSLIGFYTRFHGGLISTMAYTFLYFAFVSNMHKRQAKVALNLLLLSALIVSIYGILQHFGIDAALWQQDVRERVFSTVGQPNWLGAFLAFLIPFTQIKLLAKTKGKAFVYNFVLFIAFYTALLFTKSRSAIVGFGFSQVILWGFYFRKPTLSGSKKAITLLISLVVATFIIGTPWTKNATALFTKPTENGSDVVEDRFIPALERGGTDSTTIRKIVWKGAFAIWKRYPVLGSGVETFGLSYYMDRPVEHNMVSEWDFLYNKAHNEYLNFLATTGIVGLLAYLYLCFALFFFYLKFVLKNKKSVGVELAALSGFVSIAVSNFFGFSVVLVGIMFFVIPAIIYAFYKKEVRIVKNDSKKELDLSPLQALMGILIVFTSVYLVFLLTRLWLADVNYALGKAYNAQELYPQARENLLKATSLYAKQPEYFSELAESAAGISLLFDSSNTLEALEFSELADLESQKAVDLSPKNVNMYRFRAISLLTTSLINQEHLVKARQTLEAAIKLAPSDAKLYYNLGLVFAREGDNKKAIEIFSKTVVLKEDYRNARFALGLMHKAQGNIEAAREQFEYILTFIDPTDSLVKSELDSL